MRVSRSIEVAASDPSTSGPSGDGDIGSISQAEIDALMQGDAGAPSAVATHAAEPSANSNDIDQADIDALLNAASGGAPVAPTPAAKPAPVDTRVDTLGRPFDEAAAAMQAAMDEERAEKAAKQAAAAQAPAPLSPSAPPPDARSFAFPDFSIPERYNVDPSRVSMLGDVNLNVRIELGRSRMLVEDVLKLDEGSVVELDKLAGDPVDVYVNDRLVARGEVLVLNDNFCVRVGDVFSHDPHRILK